MLLTSNGRGRCSGLVTVDAIEASEAWDANEFDDIARAGIDPSEVCEEKFSNPR